MSLQSHPRHGNRRRSERLRLARPLVCRLGTVGVVLVDLSNYGARIEHYARTERGLQRTLRIRFQGDEIAMPARIVSSRVERFIPGEKGLTVYRSGLEFLHKEGPEFEKVRKMTSAIIAGTLVEQVANARGFQAPVKGEMPIFRGSSLVSNHFDPASTRADEHLLPERELAANVGFVRFAFDRHGWTRKWTLDPAQPREGFTVSATETWEQIESLCDLYRASNDEGRRFIQMLAQASVDSQLDLERSKLR